MPTPWLDQRQGCKKHLSFVPGIVTAFQGGLGHSSFPLFLLREDNRRGRGMNKQPGMNKFILCSAKYYIPIFLKLL